MADGQFAGGDGTVENPFLIEDIYDLSAIRNSTSAYYKLVKDIDMSNFPLFNNFPIIPSFHGTLDGDGHYIFNLNMNYPNTDSVAMIRNFYGVVRNLNIENAIVRSYRQSYGVIAAFMVGTSLIENCYVKGDVRHTNNSTINSSIYGRAGIFVGTMQANSKILNCYVEGHIVAGYASNYGQGGLVGQMEGSSIIQNCYARVTAASTGTGNARGALVGNVTGSAQVINCFRDVTLYASAGSPGTGANQTTGTPLTTEQMKESMNFVSWDADYQEPIGDEAPVKTWSIVNGYFPRLFHQVQNRMMMIETRDNTEITDIDFGYIVAGTDSAIREVTLRSKYLLNLGEIDIRWNRKPNISPYTKLRLSRTLEPFEDLETLRISGLELKFMEEIKFYVRVSTDVELEEGGAFDLNVRVTPN